MLWPELDLAGAARNLRVTITRLRRLLEPGRAGGEASYCLRSDSDTIRLVRGEKLTVDLWSFQEFGEADQLSEAVALWRGEPLPDLAGCATAEIAQIRARRVRNLLALGELRLVTADPVKARQLADRALELEPFEPRGHGWRSRPRCAHGIHKGPWRSVCACWTRCGSSGETQSRHGDPVAAVGRTQLTGFSVDGAQ